MKREARRINSGEITDEVNEQLSESTELVGLQKESGDEKGVVAIPDLIGVDTLGI